MDNRRQIYWIVIFSIAMGFLEAAVVVYLRVLYYPNGFDFPLTTMSDLVALTELGREAATVIMLGAVGVLAGKTSYQRFAIFIASFAIWDIFYYVFLCLILGWPASLLTWDILFLIPVPWIGPVLSPLIISLTMLLLASAIYYRSVYDRAHNIITIEWVLLITGSVIVILSWTIDYINYSLNADDARTAFSSYVPAIYNWYIFAIGETLLLLATFKFWRRTA